jgi:hypothetical protein
MTAFDALDDPVFNTAMFHVAASKGPSDPLSPHHASYWPISLLKAEAFSRSKSRSPVAARDKRLGDFQPPAGFSLPSIKCNPDPARLSPDDVTLVIAVLRVDN